MIIKVVEWNYLGCVGTMKSPFATQLKGTPSRRDCFVQKRVDSRQERKRRLETADEMIHSSINLSFKADRQTVHFYSLLETS